MMTFRTIKIAFLMLTLLAWGAYALDVHAADLFVKPNSDESEQATPSPSAPSPEQQDDVLDLLGESPSVEALQAEPKAQTINDFANAYYKNCMKQQDPILQGESLGMMCACTAAKVSDTMSVKNMQAMQNNDAEGKLQRSRMLMFVYTPCIEYPTQALITNQCLNNEGVRSSMKNYQRVCECLGDGMAKFMREKAPKYIEAAIRRNQNDLDPLKHLMQSRVFDEQSQYHMRSCINKHVLGGG